MRKKKFVWQKIRIEVWRFLQRILLGKPAGSLPWHWVKTVAGGYFRPGMQQHLEQLVLLHEPTIAGYPFEQRYPIQFRRSKAFDARHLYVFQGVWVSPHSALTFVPDDWMLEESAGSLEKVMGWGHILPEALLSRQELTERDPMIVVPAAPFYHFMWEHLPAIVEALRYQPEAKLLLPDPTPRFVSDALTLLLGDGWQQRAVVSGKLCLVRRLIVPQIETHSGFIHPSYPGILQEAFAHIVDDEPYGDDRIYVSRRVAPGRLMRNEAELERALERMGFKILYLENMPMAEQFRAFRRASTVVAPHGAGLSHLHFCRPGTYVLECFPNTYFNDCYARLAVQLGHRYDYLICRPDSAWEGGSLPVENVVVRIQERVGVPVGTEA